MKLNEFKKIVNTVDELNFQLPNGEMVPGHYHVTEVGGIMKNFIDCGGTVRAEKVVNFQLWYSVDFDHKLKPQKMLDIIALSESKLGLENHEIEVEYQSDTIGKYGLDFNGQNFVLTSKVTDCLAKDKCNVPVEKTMVNLAEVTTKSGYCDPGSNCC